MATVQERNRNVVQRGARPAPAKQPAWMGMPRQPEPRERQQFQRAEPTRRAVGPSARPGWMQQAYPGLSPEAYAQMVGDIGGLGRPALLQPGAQGPYAPGMSPAELQFAQAGGGQQQTIDYFRAMQAANQAAAAQGPAISGIAGTGQPGLEPDLAAQMAQVSGIAGAGVSGLAAPEEERQRESSDRGGAYTEGGFAGQGDIARFRNRDQALRLLAARRAAEQGLAGYYQTLPAGGAEPFQGGGYPYYGGYGGYGGGGGGGYAQDWWLNLARWMIQ